MEFDDSDFDRLVRLTSLGRFGHVLLSRMFVHYANQDRLRLQRLMTATKPDDLEHVWDILMMYPSTDVGWSMLPRNRAQFLTPELKPAEAEDIVNRQYQEDRAGVEYVRGNLRQG